jgi:hypothetical protein
MHFLRVHVQLAVMYVYVYVYVYTVVLVVIRLLCTWLAKVLAVVAAAAAAATVAATLRRLLLHVHVLDEKTIADETITATTITTRRSTILGMGFSEDFRGTKLFSSTSGCIASRTPKRRRMRSWRGSSPAVVTLIPFPSIW